ncbi:MAG TPA: hypothetical protein VMR52_08045 [Dehalococcoidia bacterium]|nr:hypothetical protein [Dehalococcoidia bacterium]
MVATIYESGALKVIAVCDGPHEFGQCPLVALGERVPCAGFEVALSADEWDERPAGLDRERFQVPASFRVCPLARLGASGMGERYFSPFKPDGLC